MKWQEQAACRDRGDGTPYPQEWFFVDRDSHGHSSDEANLRGLGVCAACPVANECLDYAISNKIEHGVFGAMTSAERISLRRQRSRV